VVIEHGPVPGHAGATSAERVVLVLGPGQLRNDPVRGPGIDREREVTDVTQLQVFDAQVGVLQPGVALRHDHLIHPAPHHQEPRRAAGRRLGELLQQR
jgi:hypothetical protein